ncbi:MAG: hypothetical protein AAF382_14950 [Pseudomonadota bacterium]
MRSIGVGIAILRFSDLQFYFHNPSFAIRFLRYLERRNESHHHK